MRWKGRRQSENVEVRSGKGLVVGGGAGVIVVALLVMLLGGDPGQVLEQAGRMQPTQATQIDPRDEPQKEFVAVVLADTEDVWSKLFRDAGQTYEKPKLVVFSGQVQSACGVAGASVGPFYCGMDQDVYLDLSFFRELSDRFGASGEFANAYVIAHEVGHHVQNLLGTLEQVNSQRQRMSQRDANALAVRLELQADYYAGVWAHHAKEMAELTEKDIRDALSAAEAIGDDKLQMETQGHVVPDAFTHGTSEQRMRWFMKGWQSGDPSQGDTFRATRL